MRGESNPHRWMRVALSIGGVWNLLCGVGAASLPAAAGLDAAPFARCLGVVLSFSGAGYLIAAAAPLRRVSIVLLGLFGQACALIGFVVILDHETAIPPFMIVFATNFVSWLSICVVPWEALRHQFGGSTSSHAVDDPVRDVVDANGRSLIDLSSIGPQLVVFLRHSGCTFCRESLSDLRKHRQAIEASGVGIILVHPGGHPEFQEFLARYGLDDLPSISDPSCRLYRQFGLESGSFGQLFGLRVWLRGLKAGLLDRHGIGKATGNPLQMPGAFVIHFGSPIRGFQHEWASDRADYLCLVRQALEAPPVPSTP